MQKISEWLGELDSHAIYTAAACADDFTAKTGELPCWPTHTSDETRDTIIARGLGGHLNGTTDCAYGYEIARALAAKYTNHRSSMMGRGFLFHDCLDALRKAGF